MIRSTLALLALLLVFVTAPAPAQTPTAQLATPPANAETWSIFSSAGQHGRVARWTTADGVRWSRQSLLLRGFVTEIDQQLRFSSGAPTSLTIRGVVPEGDAAETFAIANGRYSYQSSVDHGDGAMQAGAIYNPYGGTLDALIALADALRAAPNHAVNTLPSGRATMEQVATLDVSHAGATKHLTAYAILGLDLSPSVVWYEGDRFFGVADVLNILPTGWESAADAMSQAQDGALAQRSRALVDQLGPRPTQPVVFQDVRLYDSINRRFREHMTVIVNNGRVTTIGVASAVRIPSDAQVFPGAGRTLVPGLWDSHMHYGDDSTGPLLLSNGITSARDPGNRQAELQARIRRINAGELLGPRIVPSLIIDGPGPYAAQAGVIVSNEAEALAAVQRAKNEGYFGVKLYGSLPPPLVPIIAREAHRLGLRVHGHVPAGMRPLDAINAGYDEITHINFSMMQAMPDDVVNHSNSLPRFYGPGQYGGDVDPTAQPMRGLLDVMQRRHIAVDPTLVVYELIYVPEAGEIGAAYAPFSGTMPSQVERGFRSGGLAEAPEASRTSMRRAFTAMSALVREMHRRNITMVAGTDGYGIELVRELELYVAAGFTPADALAAATIVPSRLYGAPDAGQITVGKPAELFLVEGDPSTNIGDLRHVIVTMRDGRLMDANALRASIGINGMPH